MPTLGSMILNSSFSHTFWLNYEINHSGPHLPILNGRRLIQPNHKGHVLRSCLPVRHCIQHMTLIKSRGLQEVGKLRHARRWSHWAQVMQVASTGVQLKPQGVWLQSRLLPPALLEGRSLLLAATWLIKHFVEKTKGKLFAYVFY